MTLPEARPLAQAVYDRNPLGCCAHIVLDDGNVETTHVLFCTEQARERGHADCLALCEALAAMSQTQRRKLSGLVVRR